MTNAVKKRNLAQKIIAAHLADGEMRPGEEIALGIDQTLTQDATGTLVMLEVEAMGLERVRTGLSAQYVDHNLLQQDHKNPDDHRFLMTSCRRLGIWFSPAGNGVSHPVHQERFGIPGQTLLGSDSHTPAAGGLGMLAIGAGGLDVALAMAGEPFHLAMPEIWGVELTGTLPDWVSAKDVILEMLRRHGVDGATHRVLEYHGPGVATLSAMDRHVIANMGTELGATSTVFPSDEQTRAYLIGQKRVDAWQPLAADPDCAYDVEDTIDLSTLEPLIALPSSPGNVVPVAEVAGREIHQAYIGSSANPGYRDFAIAAEMVRDVRVDPRVSFDINPSSRQILRTLIRDGHLLTLIGAGARLHQTGCNGCIGMGQAPATGTISLRTVPRNFPGRSGTREDSVYLCSPETATASALTGCITDPRTLPKPYPRVTEPEIPDLDEDMVMPPLPPEAAEEVEVVRGPNIRPLPDLEPLSETIRAPVLLAVGDDVSTDEILPAGARVLPFRSNIAEIANFAFEAVDAGYPDRAREHADTGHVIVAGKNYGQGSSREHAALAPRHLGLRAVVARSFARIHRRNLINFGVLPLTFADGGDSGTLEAGDEVRLDLAGEALTRDELILQAGDREIPVRHGLSSRQIEILRAGGLLTWMKRRLAASRDQRSASRS